MGKGKKNPAKGAKSRAKKAVAETVESTEWPDAEVAIGLDTQACFDELPPPIQGRVRKIFKRLKRWPAVSGAKPLRGTYAGSFRIRTGDYRIVFKPIGGTKLRVRKIGDRKDVYLD